MKILSRMIYGHVILQLLFVVFHLGSLKQHLIAEPVLLDAS